MAYGNTVLLKPAGPAIATAALLSECADRGPARRRVRPACRCPASQAGELLDDGRIAAVTFTGSTGVGISVAERMARRAAPAQAEMGGQNPAVVLADANLDAAAAAIVGGAMGYAGQKCTATRRVIAVAGVADELEHRSPSSSPGLEVGDPRQRRGHRRSADQRRRGRRVRAGGLRRRSRPGPPRLARASAGRRVRRQRRPDGGPGPAGHLRQPGSAAPGRPGATVNQEETFGPLLTFLSGQGRSGRDRGRQRDRASAWSARSTDATSAARSRSPRGSTAACGGSTRPTPGVDYYAPFGGERPLQPRPPRAGPRRPRVLHHLPHDDYSPGLRIG